MRQPHPTVLSNDWRHASENTVLGKTANLTKLQSLPINARWHFRKKDQRKLKGVYSS